ncbi:copper homeostasis membrane protein CopD [Kosakonia radicincitans]|uniref:copper homeostasis membrane protein CopD n=1 Tax=Kosakonia radicincitans TaxID=283686 RepID=UPI0005C2A3D8|nr:copper homeostasis membrane protein CopD [Kosakonia radicincitans]KIS42295.1 copper resistance D family protein [Kosakonia radicincitans YD4]
MLETAFVGLRFVHFAALMLSFGCALFSAWLAPRSLEHLITRRFLPLQRGCLWLSALSAILMFAFQGGLMGEGWGDVWQPSTWLAVAATGFGTIWAWQIIFALLTLISLFLQPQQQRRIFVLLAVQFLLAAGVGHAAMREGAMGVLQRGNHALHLLCAAMWIGGLLPVLFCMRLAHGQSRPAAISAMLRFSHYGHFAVAGVLATGVVNTLLIEGIVPPWQNDWGRMLLLKCALVALMVVIALVNRYVLVPRLNRHHDAARQRFIVLTWAELGLGALVLAAVSLFATWEPF